MTAAKIIKSLTAHADPNRARNLSRFFKTGPGEYGEGDQFIGLTVPQLRVIARQNQELALSEIAKLLKSPIHELRLAGLLILTYQYPKTSPAHQTQIFRFYQSYRRMINNWDLVDLSAPKIMGVWLFDHPQEQIILSKLAQSPSVWDRRIAVLSTFTFIQNNHYQPSLDLSLRLLHDSHDLIHKAVGWMLREIGKRDQAVEQKFLDQNAHVMPRTMLRYAIEKFDPKLRKHYLELTSKPDQSKN